jgi:tyrosyl-tRNA synthetase
MDKVMLSPLDLKDGRVWLVKLLTAAKFAASNSEARKLITAGAVSVDGARITDPDMDIAVREGQVLRVGKKRVAAVALIREE